MRARTSVITSLVASAVVLGCTQLLGLSDPNEVLSPDAVAPSGGDATPDRAMADAPDAGSSGPLPNDGSTGPAPGDASPHLCGFTGSAYVFDGSELTPSCLACARGDGGLCPGALAACAGSPVCSCLTICITDCTLDGGSQDPCVSACGAAYSWGPPDPASDNLYSCLNQTCFDACSPL